MQHAAPPPAVFNRRAFESLTLENAQLQARLIDSFLGEVDSIKRDVAEACAEGLEAFEAEVHRLHGMSHFVGAERLTRLLTALSSTSSLKDNEAMRRQAAEQILTEIADLERALEEEVAQHLRARDDTQLSNGPR